MNPAAKGLRLQKFRCIMGTWTYVAADGLCVLGYYKSQAEAKRRLDEERRKREPKQLELFEAAA